MEFPGLILSFSFFLTLFYVCFLGHFFYFLFQPPYFHHISVFNYIFPLCIFLAPSEMSSCLPSLCPPGTSILVACLGICFPFTLSSGVGCSLAICSWLRTGQYSARVTSRSLHCIEGWVCQLWGYHRPFLGQFLSLDF